MQDAMFVCVKRAIKREIDFTFSVFGFFGELLLAACPSKKRGIKWASTKKSKWYDDCHP